MISLSTLSIFVIPRCYDKYVPGIVVVHRTLTVKTWVHLFEVWLLNIPWGLDVGAWCFSPMRLFLSVFNPWLKIPV
jgi:hypothetical protein